EVPGDFFELGAARLAVHRRLHPQRRADVVDGCRALGAKRAAVGRVVAVTLDMDDFDLARLGAAFSAEDHHAATNCTIWAGATGLVGAGQADRLAGRRVRFLDPSESEGPDGCPRHTHARSPQESAT